MKTYQTPAILRHTPDIANHFGTNARFLDKIDGVTVEDLVKRFGSPLFVFSEAALRERLREVKSLFRSHYPRVRFAWSYKTNFLDAVAGIFHQEGWDAEVVSGLEYDMARRLGLPGEKIICNGAYKPADWCRRAMDDGAYIQLDHFDELDTIEQLAESRKTPVDIGLRVNMTVSQIDSAWDRFGLNLENGDAVDAALRLSGNSKIRLTGLHCHLGTFVNSPEAYGEAAAKLATIVPLIESITGYPIRTLNLGGGFPSENVLAGLYGQPGDEPFDLTSFARRISAELLAAFSGRTILPELVLESGRSMVDHAGKLIATVVGTRRSARGERGLILDAGINILYTAHWYRHRIEPAQLTEGLVESTSIFGPLCMNIDTLQRSIPLPPLQAGDRVVIHPAGAYNVTQWMQFSQLRPAVVMIAEDGSVDVIRRAETIDDVKGQEALPARYRPEGDGRHGR